MCPYVHICRCPQRPKEDAGSHGPGVRGSCAPPDVHARKLRSCAKEVSSLYYRAISPAPHPASFDLEGPVVSLYLSPQLINSRCQGGGTRILPRRWIHGDCANSITIIHITLHKRKLKSHAY